MTADETVVGGGRFGTDAAGLSRRCCAMSAGSRTGSGRSRAAPGSATTSRSDCWPTARTSSMCRPSCRRGPGSSRPARVARPTPPTPTRSPWSGPGWPGCARSSTTSSSRCCGSWSTDADRSVRTTPGWSPSSTSCCSSSSRAARRRTSPPPRPRRSSPRSDPATRSGKTRRRVAAELVADLERIYARKKAADKELTELLAATGTTLTDLPGIGPSGAARLLVEVGDITRFPDRDHFASWNGTAPDRRLLR